MASNDFTIDLFNCGVCSEKYNQTERKPKMLDCHHTFCQMCLEQICDIEDRKRIVCPFCSAVTKPGKKGVEELKNNHYLNQFEDLLKRGTTANTKEESVTTEYYILNPTQICPKHGESNFVFYCKTCEIPVCSQCVDREHKGRIHKIGDFEDTKFVDAINTCLERLKTTLENMQADLERLLPLFRNRTKIIGNFVNSALSGVYNSLSFRVDELDTEIDVEMRKASKCNLDNINEMWALKFKLNELEKKIQQGNKDLKENVAEATELVKDNVVVCFVKPNSIFKMSFCPHCAQKLVENPAIIGASNHAVKEYRCSGCLAIINHFSKKC